MRKREKEAKRERKRKRRRKREKERKRERNKKREKGKKDRQTFRGILVQFKSYVCEGIHNHRKH